MNVQRARQPRELYLLCPQLRAFASFDRAPLFQANFHNRPIGAASSTLFRFCFSVYRPTNNEPWRHWYVVCCIFSSLTAQNLLRFAPPSVDFKGGRIAVLCVSFVRLSSHPNFDQKKMKKKVKVRKNKTRPAIKTKDRREEGSNAGARSPCCGFPM